MDEKQRCQSCGTALEIGLYGTNADGTANTEYCKLCFEKGSFREPNLTLEDMIARQVANMIDERKISQEEAVVLANRTIPALNRWKTID